MSAPLLQELGRQPFAGGSIRSVKLRNGMRVHLLAEAETPVVSYQTWFGVGSAHERKGQTGIAHFLEHLMFLGSPRFPAGTIDEALEDVGGDNNAATWVDWTYYQDDVPRGCLDVVMPIEVDRMRALAWDPESFASERDVVLSERRDRVDDDVDGTAGEVLWQLALGEHPYGHPTLGWAPDVAGLSIAAVRRFHERHYAAGGATLVVVGGFDEQATLEAIDAHYGALPASPRRRTRVPDVAPLRRTRRRTLRLPASSARVFVGYPAPRYDHPDWLSLRVLGEVLFGGRSGRAYRDLVLERELATSAWVDLPPFAAGGLFEVGAIANEGVDVDALHAAIDAHLAAVTEAPCTDDEVARARTRIEFSLVSSLETAAGRAESIGAHATLSGDPTGALARAEAYRAVTPASVLEAARRTLGRGARRARAVVRVVPR